MKGAFAASAIVGLLCGLSAAVPTFAQTAAGEKAQNQVDETVWIVTLGGGTEYGPAYEGAKNQSFDFVPSIDIRRLGEPADLSAPDDNIDYSLVEWSGLELGPVAGIRGQRTALDEGTLAGLQAVPLSVDAGAFAQYWMLPDTFRLRVEARQGLRRQDGFVADFGADMFRPFGSKLVLSAGPRLSLADTNYMRNNLGITAEEAATNGNLSAFDIGGGLKSVGFVIGASYQFTDTMSVQVYDKFDRLVGAAADSPIVTDIGSANQNIIGIVLSRSFEVRF
ncbi:MipA/OmpV family protein [Mesorhizobium sp. IMUNJ 23033]|uniref:MipA/OmpV family protein n=1 Tax=Mesorhizobium sp. IMUNJ 23033 TaxID=3378039 RepID=UPI00384FBD4F